MAIGASQPVHAPASLADPLFDQLPMPAFIVDAELRIVAVNPEFHRRFGRAATELRGRHVAVLTVREDLPALIEALGRIRHAEGEGVRHRCRMGAADGGADAVELRLRAIRLGEARVTLALVADGECIGGVGPDVVRDARLRTYEKLFEEAPVACVVRDERGAIVRVNRAYAELTGYAASELLGRTTATTQDDPGAAASLEALWRQLHGSPGAVARARGRLRTRDGRELVVERVATCVESADGHWFRITAVSDVTQRSALEDDLKRLVLQQGALLRTMSAGVMMVVDDRVVRCNPSLEGMLGLPADRIVGREITEVFRADRSWESIREDSATAIAGDAPFRCEVEVDRPGLHPITCALQLRGVDPADPCAGQIVTLHDITELNRQQASLRKANAELSALVENTAVAVCYLDGQRVVRANRLMEQLLGVGPGKLPGQLLSGFLPPEDHSAAELLRVLSDPVRRPCTVATRLRRGDGEAVACLVHLGPVDSVRWPSASILVAIDMSGQEAALSALADSQERFGRFADAIQEALFVIDTRRHGALYANLRFEQVLCVPAETFYRDAASAWRHVAPEDRATLDEMLAHALDRGTQEVDIRIDRPDGQRRVIRLRLFLARLGGHELYGLAEDVTESRESAQRRVDEAIQQRDTLVREVHHRIKNNLQGVAGLLQQAASRKPEIAAQLEEIIGQIQAIAQVHGLQVRGSGDLSLAKLVRAVLDNLSRGFGQPIGYPAERFEALESWTIPEQEAVPMALVINELGTNAIKHRQGDGGVTADLEAAGEGLTLRIRNPGVLADGFMIERLDPAPSGLSLVRALLPRRGTQLSLSREGGQVVAELRIGAPVLRRTARAAKHVG